MRTAAVTVAFCLASPAALACSGDVECGPGARCAKAFGALQGRCLAEVLAPPPAPASVPSGTVTPQHARACTFDADCGEGRTCLKQSSQMAGLCVKR